MLTKVLVQIATTATIILSQYQVVRRDPLAELASSLATRQSAACDGQELKMDCPAGTKISIQLVQYGRASPDDSLCPASLRYPGHWEGKEKGEKCLILEAIRTLEERCHGRESCSMTASPATLASGLRDPCPQVRKYVEVLFKCKPVSFRSRVVCGGETVALACPPSQPDFRLAVFSTSFGTPTSGHVFCPTPGNNVGSWQRTGFPKNSPSAVELCHNETVTGRVQNLCHGYRACSFTADPLTLSVSACLGLHLTLKTTFACVDKSVFQPKFVDRVTTTTTTTTPPTTSTLPTTRTPATRGRWQEFSTEYWDAEDEGELGVQAKPLEPKPISEEEPAHVIHIDHAEEGVEEAENFAKEHRSKLLMAAILIIALCCSSLLLVGLAKVYHYYRPAVQHQHAAITNDMDTLSSRGSLAAQEFLQLEPSSEYRAGLEGHYGSVRSVKSVTPRPPRGILKQSRTSENLATCSNSLTLYSNPAVEGQCSPLRLKDPLLLERQVVDTLAGDNTLERPLGSPMHSWQAMRRQNESPCFPSESPGSPRLLSKPEEPRGCQRDPETSLLCLRDAEEGSVAAR